MLRSTFAICLLLSALGAAPASAQQVVWGPSIAPSRPSSFDADLTDYEAQRRAAIGIYISAACITATGLGVGIVGLLGTAGAGLGGGEDEFMFANFIGGAV